MTNRNRSQVDNAAGSGQRGVVLMKSLERKRIPGLMPVVAGGLLAFAASTATARASGYDGASSSWPCGEIGCGDGSRECARAVGTIHMPVWPYLSHIDIPFDKQCYEQPAQ